MAKKGVLGYIALSNEAKAISIREEFKGEVFDKPVNFPKELGAEHPFNFEKLEKVYSRVGIISGAVNKLTDSIVGDFSVKLDNENAQALIDDFLADTNFSTVMRTWIREGILKGNGFMELDLEETKIRVMNANNMFDRRNSSGKVLEYNQFTGNLTRFSVNSRKFNSFKPDEIAHLQINKIPNDPYGIGMVSSSMRLIDNMLGLDLDLHKLISRKAGAPYHFKVGAPGENTPTSVVDGVNSNLTFLNNRTEWVTDGNVDIKLLEFTDVGKNLTDTYQHDFRMLLAGIEVPEVMMGSGQLNEGIARVQEGTFQRKVQSIREQVESVIEEKILRPLLRAHKLDERPKFEWNLQSEEEINNRIEKISNFLKMGSVISEPMKAALEIELAKLLDIEELENILITPQEAKEQAEKEAKERNMEREREEQIEQPEVPGAKPTANQILSIHMGQTTINQDHRHNFTTDNNGNGQTTNTLPTDAVPHTHEIKDFEVQTSGGHIHNLPQSFQKTQREEPEEEKPVPTIPVISASQEMTIKEFVNLQEIAGFNYTDYLVKILQVLKKDKFTDLSAITDQDIANGLLSKTDTEKLRIILNDGFKNNKTIREIESDVKRLNLPDRKVADKVVLASAFRPNAIARSETVRLANIGLVELYKENKIEKVRFLAALSDRTCPICESLNGQVFTLTELSIGASQPPIHTSCRCSLVSIVE